MKKKWITALLVPFVCMAMLMAGPGCEFSEREGKVTTVLGLLAVQFWTSIKAIEPDSDGKYRVTFKDEHTAETVITETQLDNLMTLSGKSLFDPIVIQVPEDVTGITATYNDYASLSGDMAVTANLTSVPVTPNLNLTPEAGHKLVIIEFPDVAGLIPGASEAAHWYRIDVSATVGTPREITVKAICTGKVVEGDTTYYIPLLPAVTDFAQVPSFTIPLSDTLQAITLPTAAALPATPATVSYDFSGSGGTTGGSSSHDHSCFIGSLMAPR